MNMNMSILRQTSSALALICVLLVPAISHAEGPTAVIGKVIISSGTFSAVGLDGKQRILKRRSPIYVGDTLVTSEKGRAQIRLKDGAVIDLKSASELKLEEYSFNGKQDGTERNTMNLLKGGFRTITGAIGKKNKKNYKVTTRIATIGIRGTHYGIHDCSGNCFKQTASGREQIKDGLYGGVVDGKVVMENDAGQSEFGNDQYFHLASAGEQPEYLMEPPAIVFEGSVESEEKSEASATTESAGSQETEVVATEGETIPEDFALGTTEVTEEAVIDNQVVATDTTIQLDATTGTTTQQALPPAPKSNTTNVYSFATSANGLDSEGQPGVGDVAGTFDPDREFITVTDIGGNDAFTSIYVDGNTDPKCNPCAITVNNTAGTLVKSSYAPLNVSWGRWASDSNFVISVNGTTQTTQDYFHYIYTDKSNITPPTAFQALASLYATVTYNDVGGTAPTHFDGTNTTVGSLGYATMTLDLTSQAVTQFDINLTAGGGTWTGALVGGAIPVSPVMDDIQLSVDANGSAGYGHVSGTFVGAAAEGFAGSYGMVDDMNTKAVSGTVVLER